MKKSVLSVMLAVCAIAASAQRLTKVETNYVTQRYEDAKTEIDKVMADQKAQSNPDALLWHATVYGTLYDDARYKTRFPEAGEVAMSSFMRYQQLDPAFKSMNGPIPGKTIIDILYRSNLTDGIFYFDKKQWDSAFKFFSRSAMIGDLITKYDWRGNKQAIDTTTVLFTGYAAQNAKKSDEAAKYYTRLADLKIRETAAVGDIKDVYEYLLFHYIDNQNEAEFRKYLALIRELYPQDTERWAGYESEYVERYYTLAQKAEAYDKADAAGTLTAAQYMDYGSMFYNLRDEDKEGMDSAQIAAYRNRSEGAFIKAAQKDPSNALAAYNAGLINYNDWITLDEKYEANIRKIAELNRAKAAEKDPKKKAANDARINQEIAAIRATNAAIEKQQHVFADKSAEWMERTFAVLSVKENRDRNEKNVLGKSVDYLTNLYGWKRDKSKGNNAEYDKFDALYKKYDALHDKY